MTTLFTAIFYLWLVLTILLAAMWFLREQDRRRKDQQQNELEDELLTGPATAAPVDPPTATPAAAEAGEDQQELAVEPTQPAKSRAEPSSVPSAADGDAQPTASSEQSPSAESDTTADPEAAAEDSKVEAEPLPWAKNSKNRKKKNNQRNRSKPKAKAKPVATTESATEEPAAEEPAIEEPTTAEEPATEEPTAEEAAVDETATADPAGPVDGAAQVPGIVELLDGVTLPFDLTPLTARIEDPNRHVIFISPHPDAAEVGTAFADELVQQGYEIEPAGFDQALASRGDETLTMRISPDAGKVADGSELRYPSAGETDVAIEVWVGNGSPPQLLD